MSTIGRARGLLAEGWRLVRTAVEEPAPEPALERIRWISWFLDDAISLPVTDRTFGADAIVGVIPVVGDLVAACLSGYLLVEAIRFRVPPRVFARMVFNVAVDVLLGLPPVIGFVFDVLWTANEWNATLLETHITDTFDHSE